jgi:hypothetical protein
VRHLASTVLSLLLALAALPAAAAYIESANGTVKDTVTGLTWMRCAMGQTWSGGGCNGTATAYTWTQATQLRASFGGQTDWRLPGIEELSSIVDTAQNGLKIDQNAFPNMPVALAIPAVQATAHSGFWSVSSFAPDRTRAWSINFIDGSAGAKDKSTAAGFARLVREPPATGPFGLAVAKVGTGAGNIIGNPAGITCGATCAASLAKGTSVTLTAVPAAGSFFAGWNGACVGRAPCSVTMDSGKGVKATFNLIPFEAGATRDITASGATIKANIKFNPADAGKQGSVFITGMVRAKALASALRALRSDQVVGDASTDLDSQVLIQLTASGWQQVANGQLLPYASGVMGDLLATQTILNNTDITDLKGAEFCVGYGSSASEMVSGGRMVSIASIPDPDSTSTSSGSCLVAGDINTAGSPLTGLWWNQSESGWGMSLTQLGATVFVAWYTYDQSGKPSWFVMSSCPLASNACSGDIYKVAGGTAPTVPWNGSAKVVSKVGSGTLFFNDDDSGVFSYSMNGVAASRNITRQVFASGSAEPAIDYSALWWNPAESGWGVALSQQYAMIFVTMYAYDGSGNPVWYVASSCPVSGSGCSGDLYQVTGGSAPTVAWNGANKVVSKVGSASFAFTDGSTGTMTYTINGVSGPKVITRQLF